MQPEARKNFLSFFSGYLHLPLATTQRHVDFDDFYGRSKAAEDADGPAKPLPPPAEPDDLIVGRSPLQPSLEPDPWAPLDLHAHARPIAPFVAPRLPAVPSKPLPVDAVTRSHGGGGGSEPAHQVQLPNISVDYRDGGDPLDLRASQVNTLHDNDSVLHDNDVVTDGATVAWPDHDIAPMSELAQMAETQVPAAYADATATPELIAAALREQGGSPDHAGPATLREGVTIDGVAAGADAASPPGPASLVPPSPVDHHENMAVVRTGDNVAANYAGAVDTQGDIGTLVVLGDSYRSNVIVQTNVLVDHTAVAGTADSATLQTGGNQANNMAEFIQTLDQQNPYEMGFFGGLHWHVDRATGDYYNVNLTRQLNVMQDNDKVQQTATDHYKFIGTGANVQGNLLTLDHSGMQYGLVVVTGDYFGANWIFQTNVLLNSDYVRIDAGPGGAGAETVSTGANWLTNSATIADYGGAGHALTPDMQALVTALQGGGQSLDLAKGFVVPGDGSGTMNVLFITGNYYDMNVLQQTNVVSDSDVVMQTLANGESGYVATGGNELSNDALLVTLGPLGGQYVGGTQYTEAVLVQTNIIAQSADVQPAQSTVVLGDPAKLASEAAALIVHSPTPAPPPAEESVAPQPMDSATHAATDPLSSVLS